MAERLAAAPDPQDPEIAERTTEDAEDALTTLLTQFVTDGYVVVFQANYDHDILSIEVAADGSSAQIRDCYVDHALKRDADSGDTLDEATATLHIDTTLVRAARTWKVQSVSEIDSWTGVTGCE